MEVIILSFWIKDCAVYRGSGIGWGKGQLYLNYMDKWLLVGGFEDEDE